MLTRMQERRSTRSACCKAMTHSARWPCGRRAAGVGSSPPLAAFEFNATRALHRSLRPAFVGWGGSTASTTGAARALAYRAEVRRAVAMDYQDPRAPATAASTARAPVRTPRPPLPTHIHLGRRRDDGAGLVRWRRGVDARRPRASAISRRSAHALAPTLGRPQSHLERTITPRNPVGLATASPSASGTAGAAVPVPTGLSALRSASEAAASSVTHTDIVSGIARIGQLCAGLGRRAPRICSAIRPIRACTASLAVLGAHSSRSACNCARCRQCAPPVHPATFRRHGCLAAPARSSRARLNSSSA